MNRYAYLVNVDELTNRNKFYEVFENDDGSIDVKYGRVGAKINEHHYNFGERYFDALIADKIRGGYKDVTALHAQIDVENKGKKADLSYKPIEDAEINAFITELIKASREFMEKNYTVTVQEVTPKMIIEAEADIDELCEIAECAKSGTMPHSVYQFNQKLKELFTDIPRKMNNVSEFLATTPADFEKIIYNEQEMIDNIKGMLSATKTEEKDKTVPDQTVLQAYGLQVKEATYKQEDEIIAHLGRDYDGKNVERRFVKAYCVENNRTRENYEKFKETHNLEQKDCRLFYHGSKVENWFSIMKQGLSLNPNAAVTGKMFGNGLYFAPDCRKSLNYMDVKGSHWNNGRRDTGYCAIYSVALGKQYMPSDSLHRSFGKNDLKDGCLSVYAKKEKTGLRNDEYVVYDQDQCTIKYLMEMTKFGVRDLHYNLDRNALRNNLSPAFDKLVKTPNGMKAEVMLENLPDAALSEMVNKVIDGFDVDRLYIDYNPRTSTIEFSCTDINGESKTISPPSLTTDDYKFICREMKKAFADREGEWKDISKSAENIRLGEVVAYSKSHTDDLTIETNKKITAQNIKE